MLKHSEHVSVPTATVVELEQKGITEWNVLE